MEFTELEMQQFNPNKVKRVWGIRGRGQDKTYFRAVTLYNTKTGGEFQLDISHVNGGGENEGKQPCECGAGCEFHTVRQNNLIRNAVLGQGHHWIPQPVHYQEPRVSRATMENIENERAAAAVVKTLKQTGGPVGRKASTNA